MGCGRSTKHVGLKAAIENLPTVNDGIAKVVIDPGEK